MSQAQIFQCPVCREYIATDAEACRFCKTPIDAETRRIAARAQAVENKEYRRNQYLKHMGIGALLFIGGLILTLGTLSTASSGGGAYVLKFGLLISGGADFLYGLVGYIGELREK